MNDVATKKELQAIENDVAENNNELNDLKEGLVASLVAQGHKVDANSSWKDLFDILLSGSGSVPDVPNPDVPSGDGVYLVKDGEPQNNTVFAKACLPIQWTTNNSTLYFTLGKSGMGGSHTWFSYDGYVNFNHYDRIEITLRTEKSTQRPNLIVARTLSSGTYGYMANAGYEYEELTTEMVMTTTTMTKYTFNIDDMVGDRTSNARNGYLLIHMNGGDSTESGEIYIQDIVIYPKGSENDDPIEIVIDEITIKVNETYDATKLYNLQEGYNVQYKYSAIIAIEGEHTIVGKEVGTTELEIICNGIIKTVTVNVVEPTGGIVLLSDGEYFNDTEFGSLCATPAIRDLIDDNGALVYELNTIYTTAFFSFGDTDDQYVNFNNYDAVELTVYTENNNQVPYIQVCRAGGSTNSPSGQYGYGTTVYPVNIMEHTGFYVNTKKVPTVYTVNMAELRKSSADMGSLLFIIERGDESNTADGKVYISKIVVYPEGTYYTESIDE